MSQPGFFFYPGDWLRDTRSHKLEVRGAWIDLLCLLFDNRGEITWPLEDIAQYLGIDSDTCHAILTALSRQNTASVTFHDDASVTPMSQPCHSEITPQSQQCHACVTLVSRRIKRDIKAREDAKLRKERQRDRQGRHRKVTEDVTAMSHHPSSSYSSSESSSLSLLREEKEPPISPKGFDLFWAQYPKKAGKKAAADAYKRLAPDAQLQAVMLVALTAQKAHKEQLRQAGKFAPEWPDPERWLKKRRWEDEILKDEALDSSGEEEPPYWKPAKLPTTTAK